MKASKPLLTLSEDQVACVKTLAEWCGGAHHMGTVKPFGNGIVMSFSGDVATFDFDGMTRLVILAHRDAVRISIMHGGPGSLRIGMWKRMVGERGKMSMSEWHPSLNDLQKMITKAQGG